MLDFLLAVWGVTVELAPWLLVGAAAAGLMHALLPAGLISRWMRGRGGVWRGVLVGAPLPLCSCAVIPVGLGLKRQGASDGATVGFLIATPQTGVDSVLVTAGLLGWPLALFKVATAVVTGLAGGAITDAVTPKRFSLPVIDAPTGAKRPEGAGARLLGGLRHADDLIRAIWVWLVVGVVVSGAIGWLAPADALTGLSAYGGAAAMGVALAVSTPLYVCATASAPVAASLVAAGMPLGAVIVFLMAGPATNAATVGAVYRSIGARALVVYLATILVGSVVGGLLFQHWFPATTMPVVAGEVHEHGAGPVAVGSAAVLTLWVLFCAARDLGRGQVSHGHSTAEVA